MPNPLRSFLKKYGSLLYIALMSLAVVIIVLKNNEAGSILEAVRGMRTDMVLCACACILIYYLLRSAVLWVFARRNGYPVSFLRAMCTNGAGQFYSAITPSASGGQPVQVYRLHRYGMPVSIATACISVEFIGFQLSYLILGLVAWLLERDFIADRIVGFGWLVILGYLINGGIIFLIALAVINVNALNRVLGALIRLGARLRLIKSPECVLEQTTASMLEFRTAMTTLIKKPITALIIAVLSLLEIIAYMAVPVFLYYAFDLTGSTALQIIGMQLFLFIAASYMPLPGSAGAQESGFCLFYRDIFPAETMASAMLCWRFLTYYLQMFVGYLMMVAENLWLEKNGRDPS